MQYFKNFKLINWLVLLILLALVLILPRLKPPKGKSTLSLESQRSPSEKKYPQRIRPQIPKIPKLRPLPRDYEVPKPYYLKPPHLLKKIPVPKLITPRP